MNRLIFMFFIFSLTSCNSQNKEENVYKSSEKETIIYDNILIKDSTAKKLFLHGLKLIENNNYDSAYQYFLKANQKESKNVIIINGLANIENVVGKRAEAENRYKNALKIDSSYVISYVNYGKLLNQNKKYSEANKILNFGLKKNPSNSEKTGLYYNLTYTMVNIGDCNKAKEYANLARQNSEILEQQLEIDNLIRDVEQYCRSK